MRVLFLDFDGVVTAKNGTPGSYMTHGPDGYGPTPACLSRLLRLAEDGGAKIVISSNWRKFDADGPGSVWAHPLYGSVENPLPKFLPMLGGFYLESLPPVRHVRKAALAEAWLAGRKDVESWAALDDMCAAEGFSSSPAFEGRYLETDPETGLTDEDCKAVLAMLGTPAV